jgi:hypothetical protein
MKYHYGKRYNTETGDLLIPKETLKYPWGDITSAFYEADLYRSRSGEYFLYGHGGSLSVFRGKKENTIIPLDKDDAKRICREFMNPKAYQEEFGT